MILTVNGEILPEELGITMCHEHLAVDLSPVRGDKDSDFDDSSLIIDELNKMKQYGVKSVVEVSCNDMGRDVKKLQMYSKACGIHIIAATGFYLAEYHTQKVRESNRTCINWIWIWCCRLCEVLLRSRFPFYQLCDQVAFKWIAPDCIKIYPISCSILLCKCTVSEPLQYGGRKKRVVKYITDVPYKHYWSCMHLGLPVLRTDLKRSCKTR